MFRKKRLGCYLRRLFGRLRQQLSDSGVFGCFVSPELSFNVLLFSSGELTVAACMVAADSPDLAGDPFGDWVAYHTVGLCRLTV